MKKEKQNMTNILYIAIGIGIVFILTLGIILSSYSNNVKDKESMYDVKQIEKTSFLDKTRFDKVEDGVFIDKFYQQTIGIEEFQKRLYLTNAFLTQHNGAITYQTELDYINFINKYN